MSGNLHVGGWEPPGLSHVAVPFRGEERGADPQALGQARGGGAGRTGPCLLSPPLPFLQVSPSDSTLKREFSLDLVVMATLLTKSSFRGGGWLTQKLRGLGEGVRSDGFMSRACFHTRTEAAQVVWTPLPPGLSGPLVPRPLPCECHRTSIPSACGLDPAAAGSWGCVQPWHQALSRVRSPVLSLWKPRLRGPGFSCLGLPRRLVWCPSPFRLWTLNKPYLGSVPPLRLGLRLNAVMTRSPGRADWGRAVGPGIQVSALRAGGG